MNLEFIKTIVLVSCLILIFDYFWLKYIFIHSWTKMMNQIQLRPLNHTVEYAIPVYILMITSIIIYVLPKVNNKNTLLKDSILYGGLLGLIIYGIFDFTNMIFFEKYSIFLGSIDIIWGTFLFTIVTFITKKILFSTKYIL